MKCSCFFFLFGLAIGTLAFSQGKSLMIKQIVINAKPRSIAIEPAKTAVVVVDMQNDFGSKGGMLDRMGFDLSPSQKTIVPTAEILAASRKTGIKIIYLKMAFQPDLSDLGDSTSPNCIVHMGAGVGKSNTAPGGMESRILIRDTWDTDIVPELKPQDGDIIVYKNRFSGFYRTNLDSILKSLNIKYLLVTGWTTSICVEATVRDAMYRDYSAVVLADCVTEPIGQGFCRSNHEASLQIIQARLGYVSNSEDFLRSVIRQKDGAQK